MYLYITIAITFIIFIGLLNPDSELNTWERLLQIYKDHELKRLDKELEIEKELTRRREIEIKGGE